MTGVNISDDGSYSVKLGTSEGLVLKAENLVLSGARFTISGLNLSFCKQ
jgi:hypothetical protein